MFERFAAGANDPELDRQAWALENSLYGRRADGKAGTWHAGTFYASVAKARKKGRKAGGPGQPAGGLQPLNPAG